MLPAGTFELNSTETGWTFTPNANFNGNVNLSYKVTDGIDSTDAANSFNLAAVNDVPALTWRQSRADCRHGRHRLHHRHQ